MFKVIHTLDKLKEKWLGTEYDLIRKNCNHFSSAVCMLLVGRPIPSWVNRLANMGGGLADIFGRPGFLGGTSKHRAFEQTLKKNH